MAAGQMDATPDQGASGSSQRKVMSFETAPEPSEEPGPLHEPEEAVHKERPTGLLTVAAIVLSLAIAVPTILLVEVPLSTVEQVVYIAVATVVLMLGLLPMRWGWYVMAAVTVAFFGLNLYNLITDAEVFRFYNGSQQAFAILYPGIGVVVGGAMQGLYRLIGGE